MATVLYKNGEPVRVDALRVSNHLENGYFLCCEDSIEKTPEPKKKAAKKPQATKTPKAKK